MSQRSVRANDSADYYAASDGASATVLPPLSTAGNLRLNLLDLVHLGSARDVAPVPVVRRRATSWADLQREVRAALGVLDVVVAALVGGLLALGGVGPRAGLWLLGVVAVLALLVWAQGGASAAAVRRGTYGRPAVVRAGAVTGLGCLAVAELVGTLPPPAAVAALPMSAAAMYVTRTTAAWWVRHGCETGRVRPRTLLLGSADAVSALVGGGGMAGCEVVGRCADDEPAPGAGVPVLGSEDRLTDVLAAHRVDQVVVAGDLEPARARRLSNELAATGAALVLAPAVTDIAASRVHQLPMGSTWQLRLLLEPRRPRVVGKGLLDRAAGALLLLLAAPVLAGCAVAVRLGSPGPMFYGQTRMGQYGQSFRMWKLRSMYTGADAQLHQLAQHDEGNGVQFKMRRDPRVTPVGAVLRRYSLDELPQLWNVVRGEMSLVGPRPPLPAEVARYRDEEPRRLLAKPGLTGLWQVGGRSDLSWADSIRLDLRYVDNRSLGLDARILADTARAVLGGRGAY